MAKKSPLSSAEKGMCFDVAGTGTAAESAGFVFYEEFANERLAKTLENSNY